jgi:3',5'-cyclic AMP phosphodiesterase CpdA
MHPRPDDLPYEDEENLWDIVRRHNVLLILHGHWHRVMQTRWRKFDLLAPAGFAFGSGKCSECHPIFGVVRITNESIKAYSWHWYNKEFLPEPSFVKSLVKGKSKKALKSRHTVDSMSSAPVRADAEENESD